MDKKPLIVVSLCAVVLLVLGSLSNVVGYQSVKSSVSDSPLFQTRTQRAINQQQVILSSKYLGRGKGNLLQFSFRDNRAEQLKKALVFISKMDDESFERFTKLYIQRARQNTTLNNINSNEIIQVFKLLRTEPEISLNYFIYRNNQHMKLNGYTVGEIWPPGCLLYALIGFLIVGIGIIYVIYNSIFNPTSLISCSSHTCPGNNLENVRL